MTLMSDPKASYFTIVDAVLSGPKDIDPDDLISVLGKFGFLRNVSGYNFEIRCKSEYPSKSKKVGG